MTLNKRGASEYTKISFPLKYGIYSEIETKDAILQFNLNHEIVRAKGKSRQWLQPSEWLKRSMGNDWIYYSTGGYTGVFEATGEYYLPNLPYPTNSLLGGKPLNEPAVEHLLSSWQEIIDKSLESLNSPNNQKLSDTLKASSDTLGLSDVRNGVRPGLMEIDSENFCSKEDYCKFSSFLEHALANTPQTLQQKADALIEASGGRITVMPPDARHVDYDIIPVSISDGCLYKCRFCRVKSDKPFAVKTSEKIEEQLVKLKEIYGKDIVNYNAIFLGDHDALNAGKDSILSAAQTAYRCFCFSNSYIQGSSLFMFGSVDSLMNADPSLFESLNSLPYQTYINIGLESADQETLNMIGKPLTASQVEDAFMEIQRINARFSNIEVTANFIMDENLPAGHYPSFLRLVRESIERPKTKGAVYLSPLRINKPSREVLFEFNRLKTLSRVPTFLYIIQRL
ncbi:MAG: radical SAM domain-containing protein [Desulfamplus sp.]|nr:radical SAM domain-containing protein [Desulfamplus sp.]MBF0258485.1 radical SAM domain-containing protein [Desulfamplus sp.]